MILHVIRHILHALNWAPPPQNSMVYVRQVLVISKCQLGCFSFLLSMDAAPAHLPRRENDALDHLCGAYYH